MSKKKQFRINKKTIIIAIVVVIALALLYFINARNGGDNAALTNNLINTLFNDETFALDDVPNAETVPTADNAPDTSTASDYVTYKFRNNNLLSDHYNKHGREMGFASKEAYEKAASDVINNPDALSKTEKEDGDYVYYVEATNEFVILSTDGYIRTYFLPSSGLAYYNRQ